MPGQEEDDADHVQPSKKLKSTKALELEEWVKLLRNKFGENTVFMTIVNEEGDASFVVNNQDVAASLDRFRLDLPGFKKFNSRKADGQKSLVSLGVIPPGKARLIKLYGNSQHLPPHSLEEVYVCTRTAFERTSPTRNPNAELENANDEEDQAPESERTKKRKSHILPLGSCTFEFTTRTLMDGDATVFTFNEGCHVHTCPTEDRGSQYVPFTQAETEDLKLQLMQFTPEEVFKNCIVPLVKLHEHKAFMPKICMFTTPLLERFAKCYGLSRHVPKGDPDFAATKAVLLEMQSNGANVAFKLPGKDASQCELLADGAKPFLKKNDLFIFISTAVQMKLLSKFGTMMGSDGTHCVFQYKRVLVIVVMTFSFDPNNAGVRDCGFNIAMVVTTSDRASIHTAIIEQLRWGMARAKMGSWIPKALMTDMAFAASNAWKEAFPSMEFLWCAFHVWQAINLKLKRLKRPDGMDAVDFEHLIGMLVKEMLHLVSPEGYTLQESEFDERAKCVSDVVWSLGLTDLATFLDMYFEKRERWAPHARRRVSNKLFPNVDFTIRDLPICMKTNNSVEGFNNNLKHVILKGKPAETFVSFLEVWRVYQARMRINAARAGIDLGVSASESEAQSDDDVQLGEFIIAPEHIEKEAEQGEMEMESAELEDEIIAKQGETETEFEESEYEVKEKRGNMSESDDGVNNETDNVIEVSGVAATVAGSNDGSAMAKRQSTARSQSLNEASNVEARDKALLLVKRFQVFADKLRDGNEDGELWLKTVNDICGFTRSVEGYGDGMVAGVPLATSASKSFERQATNFGASSKSFAAAGGPALAANDVFGVDATALEKQKTEKESVFLIDID